MVTIYRITNLKNGKIYIGKTVSKLKDRWARHLYAAKKGLKTYFSNAIRKHGKNSFKIEDIASCSDRQSSAVEIYFINKFKSYDRLIGYNSTLGGEGVRATEETKRKISRSNKGRVHTKEARLNMSLSHQGMFGERASHFNHGVRNSEILELYSDGLTMEEIADYFDVAHSTIKRRLRRIRNVKNNTYICTNFSGGRG